MANYTREIAHMLDRLNTKILSQDKVGFFRKKLNIKLNLLEMLLIKQVGEHGEMGLNHLISTLEVDRNLVTTTLKRLIRFKIVKKKPDEADGRGQIISLQLSGIELYESLLKAQERELDFILSDISINEEKAILKFLSKSVQFHTEKYGVK